MRFDLNFFTHILKKIDTHKASFSFFLPEYLVRFFFLKKVKPFPDCKMIKLLQIKTPCFCHYDNLAKTRSRMTTAIASSRQNDAG